MHLVTPTLSGLHVSLLCVSPEQQLVVALQVAFAVRQIEPLGLHCVTIAHTPNASAGFSLWQIWLQQSRSVTQRSPDGRQPLACWQMDTPVGAYGPHVRLQQSAPHGAAPSLLTAHTTPSSVHDDCVKPHDP